METIGSRRMSVDISSQGWLRTHNRFLASSSCQLEMEWEIRDDSLLLLLQLLPLVDDEDEDEDDGSRFMVALREVLMVRKEKKEKNRNFVEFFLKKKGKNRNFRPIVDI
ncbi:hypothetical protein PPACK8108_LOCUS9891 [Phakopsora pachyrhizi]|uniref:Uncharacterized protein n=1 Tax=Phakopsora pachyrhizi TaxID=170000 RepID=A0AAV0AZQ7_PHAPC|nr:hypothetical protein PPACK8108_LOCUS9891 [Phakopsora pachyrhizi]